MNKLSSDGLDLCLYPHCRGVKALRFEWIFGNNKPKAFFLWLRCTVKEMCEWYTSNSCPHFCPCKLDALGGKVVFIYTCARKNKSYFWFSSLYWRASAVVKEASALMQSDCCLSHHNVLKIYLKALYQRVPLPYQSTRSFLEHWTWFST